MDHTLLVFHILQRLLIRYGQYYGEGRPLAQFRFYPDPPVVLLNNRFYNREAQPRSARFLRHIARPEEFIKQVGLIRRRDPWTRIRNT